MHVLSDREALLFLGFETYPSLAELRSRYLALAKKLHPDTSRGDHESFKRLSRYYRHLRAKIGR